ncbi:MAG: phenylalanine--tRNA ligase subunit beta, partial [Melioribacteraceae bacterium]|nr:phenylalanine--tRNA ligase subunit beta [Melioribacteraceae bacterium]
EKSSGMICAEDELGFSDDHSGIMVLNDNVEIGQPLSTALNMDDIVLDIAITPNRADALSHIGIARDLAAIFGKKINYPALPDFKDVSHKNDFAEVVIENATDCPRYSAVIVKDVKIEESPGWLKDKLTSIGLRPVNNIVDITNFVLHETGQPLHAFDLNQLSDSKIVVKNHQENFTFTTLDSKERSMLPSDLMIFDGARPVAIAGVMGGENSEVRDDTKDILIESAYFNPSSVRKTAKHLFLSTDSSYRFERGTDPSGTLKSALRAADLIVKVAGGEIIKDVIDVYPEEIGKNKVKLRYSRISIILGYVIDKKKVAQIIEGLEFNIIESDENEILVEIPTFRHDIEREIDLIEEVVRIHGFDNIPNIEKINIASIHTPPSMASGSILLMSKINNLNITKQMIAEKFGVTQTTVSKSYEKLVDYGAILISDDLTNEIVEFIKQVEKDIKMPPEVMQKYVEFKANFSNDTFYKRMDADNKRLEDRKQALNNKYRLLKFNKKVHAD